MIKPEKKEESFLKTIFIALICAGFVRSFFFEPFHIPSSSMKPNLLIGDYIFVSKYSYGYSRYSFPFGFNIFEGRIWESEPKRGDVVVFRLPSNPKINYVKRLIGLPGDQIQVRGGVVYINDKAVKKDEDGIFLDEDVQGLSEIKRYRETLAEGNSFAVLDQNQFSQSDDTGIYEVPQGHYFMMGDNRDNSQDSRFLEYVGYVPAQNLIGKARIIFFSNGGSVWKVWNWYKTIRFERIFEKVE